MRRRGAGVWGGSWGAVWSMRVRADLTGQFLPVGPPAGLRARLR